VRGVWAGGRWKSLISRERRHRFESVRPKVSGQARKCGGTCLAPCDNMACRACGRERRAVEVAEDAIVAEAREELNLSGLSRQTLDNERWIEEFFP
jgi:hypothetical protein